MSNGERELLDEQIRYYRARAAEYDATTTPDEDPYAAAANRIRSALRAAKFHSDEPFYWGHASR